MLDVKISPASIVIALAMILILGAFGWLTFGPKPAPPPPPVLTPEAKAYIGNLQFGNVHIQAAESMVNQRLVEILGDITNKGNRNVKLAEVTCTGNLPLGSLASIRAPLPHPASATTAARAAKKLLPAPLLMAGRNIPPALVADAG